MSIDGCWKTCNPAAIYVSIVIGVQEIKLYLPNVITPSKSDGLNDFLSLPQRCRNQIADFEIMIFNRWGEKVFYSTDKNFCWYGEHRGETFYDDVFLLQLEGDFHCMTMEIYDRLGKQVYRQESSESLFWDASGVSDGVYYCAIDYWCAVSSNKRQRINTSVMVVR